MPNEDVRLREPQFVEQAQEALTFDDVVEHVLDVFAAPLSDRPLRHAIRAILHAYRIFPTLRDWRHYKAAGVIATAAQYATGTIAYTHSTRTVTLTDGTWPSWMEFGKIRIGNVDYEVESVTDTTNLVLREYTNPGADVDSGTSYTAVRARYPLPVDYRQSFTLIHSNNLNILDPTTVESLHVRDALNYKTEGLPISWTVVKDPKYYGRSIEISPAPDTSQKIAFIYTRAPKQLKTRRYATGTVSTTSTAVEGSGTTFTDRMRGAIIRFSGTTDVPTSIIGSRYNTDNSYTYERSLMNVTNATQASIDSSLDSDISGKAYVISDPIDIEKGSMTDAFLRMCELEFAILNNRDDVAQRRALFNSSLMDAFMADQGQLEIQNANISEEYYPTTWGAVTVKPS